MREYKVSLNLNDGSTFEVFLDADDLADLKGIIFMGIIEFEKDGHTMFIQASNIASVWVHN